MLFPFFLVPVPISSLFSKSSTAGVTPVDYAVTSTGNITSAAVHGPAPKSGISWCSEFNDANAFLAVKFATDVQISNISINTANSGGFLMYYAPSGQGLRLLKERGVTKVIPYTS